MATWATVADVFETTGETVTEAKLKQAQGTVSIYANRSPALDTDKISPRDLHTLNQAVCWQAAYQAQQPGYAGRQNVQETGQDGGKIIWSRNANEVGAGHAVTLAPLAARAIKNLSWKGDRTQRRRHIRNKTGASALGDDPLRDQVFPWQPWGWP